MSLLSAEPAGLEDSTRIFESPGMAEDPILNLLDYCQKHQVDISKKIAPKRVEGKGLGMYAVEAIAIGERLIHVPTKTLFTTKQIPLSFADAQVRKAIPVHALLAAYFAFGTDKQHDNLAPWMATWPKLSEFLETVPMLWGEESRNALISTNQQPIENIPSPYSGYTRLTAVTPTLSGGYLTAKDDKADRSGSTIIVDEQLEKIESHIRSLEPILKEEVWSAIQGSTPTYYRFVHMWLCVNTRCFSYVPFGTKAPSDPNEAMALCPGMDLFNHAETPGVQTKFDKTGYFAKATRDHAAGEEILFNYGHHSNDVLWAEYGFLLMPPPSYDAIRIDRVVLTGVGPEQRELLDAHGYLGDYWLTKDGVCWRTEVVAWLSILSKAQWKSMIEGIYDPEQEEHAGKGSTTSKRKRDGHVRAHRTICAGWVAKVEADAAVTLRDLEDPPYESVWTLRDADGAINNQHVAEYGNELDYGECISISHNRAVGRQVMCLNRWRQIVWMAEQAGRKIESGA
jgi:hypothetical protein